MHCGRRAHASLGCGLVDGLEYSLHQLGEAVKRMHSRAEKILCEELLLGMKLPDGYENFVDLMNEDFSEGKHDHNFLCAMENAPIAARSSLAVLLHIWNDPNLRMSFFEITIAMQDGLQEDLGKIAFRKSRIQTYLDCCQQLQKLLLTLLHVTSGGPARASEMAYLLRNSSRANRNVYVVQGDIVMMRRYNKTEWIMDRSRLIPRFPDVFTSSLFMKMFLFVRPLEELFVRDIHSPETAENHRLYVFCDKGKPYGPEKCSRAIQEVFSEEGIPFNMRQYRQYHSAMARTVLPKNLQKCIEEDRDNSGDASFLDLGCDESLDMETEITYHSTSNVNNLVHIYPIHEQAGHTLKTAERLYGISGKDAAGLDDADFGDYRLVSRAWHRSIGLCGEQSCLRKRARKIENVQRDDGIRNATVSVPPLKRAREREPEVSSDMLKVEHQNVRPTTPAFNSQQENVSQAGVDTIVGGAETLELLRHLRSMFKKRDTVFRSQEQLQATYEMLQGSRHLVIVMPTGSGKSAIVLLTVFVEQTRFDSERDAKRANMLKQLHQKPSAVANKSTSSTYKTQGKLDIAENGIISPLTIVVVPLVALCTDLLRRCKAAGIRSGKWQNRNDVESFSILVISVENVATKDFITLIGEQKNRGRLKRIVVEEAHTTNSWSDFRPSYECFDSIFAAGGKTVQIVLETATSSPHTTPDLASKHGVRDFKEIRVPTVRRNLSFKVKLFTPGKFQGVEKQLCERTAKEALFEIDYWYKHFIPKEGLKAVQIVVYCPTTRLRQQACKTFEEQYAERFGDCHILGYDSKLSTEEKTAVLNRWNEFTASCASLHSKAKGTSAHFQVVIATCAFGMGIDSPLVRSVIHMGYSRSIAEYVRESGRAGRDGSLARCILLYSPNLLQRERAWISNTPSEKIESMRLDAITFPNPAVAVMKRRDFELTLFEQWVANHHSCRRQMLFRYMDGIASSICLFDTKSEIALCDYCEKLTSDACPAMVLPETLTFQESYHSSAISGTMTDVRGLELYPAIDGQHTDALAMKTTQSVPIVRNRKTPKKNRPVERQSARTRLESFKEVCSELTRLCIVCIIERGVKVPKKECGKECTDWRCFRCLQKGHSASECELMPFRPFKKSSRRLAPVETERKNHCYACSLRQWFMIQMHEVSEFSRVSVCPYVPAFRLAAVAWNDPVWREKMVDKFDLRVLEEQQLLDSSKSSVLFFKWLREEDSHEHRMRLMQVIKHILQAACTVANEELDAAVGSTTV